MESGAVLRWVGVLEAQADELDASAGRLRALAADVDWASPAARAAQGRLDLLLGLLTGGAADLREAAALVRAHGVAVARSVELAQAAATRAATAAASAVVQGTTR